MDSSDSQSISDYSPSDTCEDKRYKCLIKGCKASYVQQWKLEIHKRKHTGERPFICDISDCSKAYTKQAHLKRHKCLVHEKSSEIMCDVKGCGLVLSNKYSLKRHMRKHTSNYAFTCSECSQGFQKKWQLNEHFYLHTGEPPFKAVFYSMLFLDHKCIICNKVFTTKTNLNQHSLCHIEESKRDIYRCPYIDCKRSYQYKKNLNYHIAAFHEKLKYEQIKCTESGCETVLKSKKNLKQHILKVHNNIPKKKKEHRPRKDKGKPKKCMASIMSGVQLPSDEHLTTINKFEVLSENAAEHDVAVDNTNNLNVVKKPLNQSIPKLDNKRLQELNKFTGDEINSNKLSNDTFENKRESCGSLIKKKILAEPFLEKKSKEKFVEIVCKDLIKKMSPCILLLQLYNEVLKRAVDYPNNMSRLNR
ncbi:hypothetical protein NQ314_008140 [Rhamnusium bicolor]|uniref:C2H2-type domain-containing protein n=1 Tax=Rhamnusium bicolor TaxID=1586634 RepID=A0AAV8YGU9_9CUCU|nr:hypothetical protein NQ314_008140 [Rhamnusium bicolor]